MKLSESSIRDEFFTHVTDTPDATKTTYNVTKIRAYCEANKLQLYRIPIQPEQAEFCLVNRGVEEDRIASLMRDQNGWNAAKQPIILVHMDDDSYLMVDGTHRYVLFHRVEAKNILAYMVEFEQIKQFIMEDLEVDDRALTEWSGMSVIRDLLGHK